jgi:ribosome recycling factor
MEDTLKHFTAAAERAQQHLGDSVGQLRTDRATPALVERISVEAYGGTQPIVALGAIAVDDARTLKIQAWDPQLGPVIGKAIAASPLGVNPTVEGGIIRVSLPPLTAERRTALLKTLGEMREAARIAIRSARDEALKAIRGMEKDGTISEDAAKSETRELERAVEGATTAIEELIERKRQELTPP